MGRRVGIIDYDETKKIMKENEDFAEYVRAYCHSSGKTIEQALRERIVQEVTQSYSEV